MYTLYIPGMSRLLRCYFDSESNNNINVQLKNFEGLLDATFAGSSGEDGFFYTGGVLTRQNNKANFEEEIFLEENGFIY